MFQDWSSNRVMASIKEMLPEDCRVVRNGLQISTPASELVPGDIVFIKAGDKLPADLRFLQVSGDAKMDRAVLFGVSVLLVVLVVFFVDNHLETKCIVFLGFFCL